MVVEEDGVKETMGREKKEDMILIMMKLIYLITH